MSQYLPSAIFLMKIVTPKEKKNTISHWANSFGGEMAWLGEKVNSFPPLPWSQTDLGPPQLLLNLQRRSRKYNHGSPSVMPSCNIQKCPNPDGETVVLQMLVAYNSHHPSPSIKLDGIDGS